MIKFIKEKIKEWKFNRELNRLLKNPIMVIETTVYVEKKPVVDVKKSHNVVKKHTKRAKIQKKVKKNAKKRS